MKIWKTAKASLACKELLIANPQAPLREQVRNLMRVRRLARHWNDGSRGTSVPPDAAARRSFLEFKPSLRSEGHDIAGWGEHAHESILRQHIESVVGRICRIVPTSGVLADAGAPAEYSFWVC